MVRAALLWLVVFGASCWRNGDELVVRTVSEYSGLPMQDVRVQVDDQAWVTTDAEGKARFAAVTGSFTVRIHQSFSAEGGAYRADKVWELRGRSGADVVVMVDGTPAPHHEGIVSGTVSGRSGSASSAVWVWISGGARGNGHGGEVLARSDGTFDLPVAWEGAPAATLTLRAVESDGASPPGDYLGFGATVVTLSDTGIGASVSGVTLPLQPVTEATVTGTVSTPVILSGAPSSSAVLAVFGEFDHRRLGTGPSPPSTFSLAVPQITGAAPWVGFIAGTAPASQHARRVELSSSAVAFSLPDPVELLEPADAASIGPATTFRWGAGPAGGTYALVVYCSWSDGGVTRSVGFRGIETGSTSAALPAIPGLTMAAGAACDWQVFWRATADPALESRWSSSAKRHGTSGP